MLRYRKIISIAILSVAFCCCPMFYAQNRTIDSLKILLKKDKEDTNKVFRFYTLCKSYTNINTDTALYYGNASLELAKKLKFRRGMAKSYGKIGNIYDNQGNYSKALEKYFTALTIFKEIGAERSIAASYNNIGVTYWNQGNYSEAVKNYLSALKIFEKMNDEDGIANSYDNIGTIYLNQGNYSKALGNHLQALNITKKISDKEGMANAYNNIGTVYQTQKNDSEALINYFKALEIFEDIGHKIGIAASYNNIGTIYQEQNNYFNALKNHLNALRIKEEIEDNQGLVISYINISSIYKNLNQLLQAIEYCSKALSLSKEVGYKDGVKSSYQLLSEIYAKNNNYKKAYQYQTLYSQLKDSLLNEANNENIARMEAVYDTEKKDKAITLLQKENDLKKLELEKKDAEIKYENTIRNSLIVGTCLIFITGLTLIISYRRKIKTNQLLSSQAENLHKQEITNLLKDQNLKTMELKLAGQKDERKRIAMDLHDSLGGTLAGIKLRLINSHIGSEKKQELEQLIDSACEEVRTISHDLIPLHLENNTFTSAIQNLTNEFNRSNGIEIHLDFTSEENLNHLNEDIQVEVYRILQELIKNTIKHSKATLLEIDISLCDNELTILLEDNGIGFDISKKANGIGLKNMQSRTTGLNGSFQIDSKIGRGTAIQILIPIKQLVV